MSETAAGRRLGPYVLEEPIGQGGMGMVYRAHQPSADRDVAIKVIGEPYARHPAFVERFRQEAQAAARLLHPHILPVYDVGVERGQPYLVMAYARGGALAARIAAAPAGLPLDEVVCITRQVAAALDHAHRTGIVHCDVKPGNVLLAVQDDGPDSAYLADFGVAQMAETAGLLPGRPPGTRPYVAPEVLAGESPTPASDIYALGVLVFEMLTGRHPAGADDDAALFLRERGIVTPADVRAWRPDLPPGVGVVIRQSLQRDPDSRPRRAEALAGALALAARGPAGPAGEALPSAGDGAPAGGDTPPGGLPTPPPDAVLLSPLQTRPGLATLPSAEPPPSPERPDLPVLTGSTRLLLWIINAALTIVLVILFLLVLGSLSRVPGY